MNSLWQDLKFAARSLAKHAGSTIVVVVILAFGIGANTAIFSILDPLLVRKLPVQKPEELVYIGATGYMGPLEISETQAFRTYREKSEEFSGVFAFAPETGYELNRSGEGIAATGEIVSGNYFSVLGVLPVAGRLLTPDDEPNGPALVLSFDCWKRAFDADPSVVGRVVQVNNASYTVVGVAPPEFFGMEIGKSPDLYLPLTATGPTSADWVHIFGRLKPGVSISQARASLGAAFQEVTRNSSIPKVELDEWMERLDLTGASHGLSELRAHFSLPVRMLMAVVALVLLIACANVANILLARAVARRKELSLKQALGAGRWRLAQQLIAESFLLILLGTVLGLLLRQWITSYLIAAISSKRLPFTLAASFNFRVFIFALGVHALTTLLCGLAPAFYAIRPGLMNDLKVHETGPSGPNQWRITNLLVVAQVGLTVSVLTGASLLLHSLVNLETFDAGFDRDHVLLVSLRSHGSLKPGRLANEQLSERVETLPGVRSVSWSSSPPTSGMQLGVNLNIEGYTLRPGENAHAFFSPISPHYFQTLGIPLLQGRDFTLADMQKPSHTVIINRTMARRFFGDSSPLGKHMQMVEGNNPPFEIVGVVADSKYNDLREGATPFFYAPTASSFTLEIRYVGDPRPLEVFLPALVRSMDSSISIASVKTLRAQLDESLHFDRVIATLCGAFGLLALTLMCLGLYGTLTFRVMRRTREIGIRMALGAQREALVRMFLRQGLLLTGLGVFCGLIAAAGLTRLMTSLLFHVSSMDPITYLGVTVVLMVTATLASYVPSRSAATVDPVETLRAE